MPVAFLRKFVFGVRASHSDSPKRESWRKLRLESLEDRRLMTAMPFGATETDTAEFLLGRVAVTPVLLESNGRLDTSTKDWTAAHKAEVLANIQTGLQFWVDLLATKSSVHTLDWIIDRTFLDNPAETVYEPITRISNDYGRWVPEFLTNQGFNSGSSLEANMRAFNNSQREKLNTDWSFTIFVVNSEGTNGAFANGGSFSRAFAFAGGLFEVVPSTRPASTYAHETGHIFYARDEYSGGGNYYQRRGYYDSLNVNAVDQNPTPNFVQQVSIMAAGTLLETAYNNVETTAGTLELLGWRDSDNDGIFDVLDVPLGLDGIGRYDAAAQTYRFTGRAFAQTLANQNSSGNGNSITLNKVTDVQYRFAGDSQWTNLSQPNSYEATLDLSIPISTANLNRTIEIRAIDARIGIASATFAAAIAAHPKSADLPGIQGFAWNDKNGNGVFDINETARAGWTVELLTSTGQSLNTYREVAVDALPEGSLQSDFFAGFSIGVTGGGGVGVGAAVVGSGKAIRPYSVSNNRLLDAWNSSQSLQLVNSNEFTSFSIDVTAVSSSATVRIRGLDSAGQIVASQSFTADGTTKTIQIQSPERNLRQVQVQILGASIVSLGNFAIGSPTVVPIDERGRFYLSEAPQGSYQLRLNSPRDIYQFTTVGGGQFSLAVTADQQLVAQDFGAKLPDNAWSRPSNPIDLDGDGNYLPLDVLQVVNAINRYGIGPLETSTVPLDRIVDANLDLVLSSLDVLAIVNRINAERRRSGGGEGEISGSSLSAKTIIQSPVQTPSVLSQLAFSQLSPNASPPEASIESGFGGNLIAEGEARFLYVSDDVRSVKRVERKPVLSSPLSQQTGFFQRTEKRDLADVSAQSIDKFLSQISDFDPIG